MTLRQFREITKDMPDHYDLFVGERLTEFKYGLVNSVTVKEINFMEEPDGPVLSKDKVIVIEED